MTRWLIRPLLAALVAVLLLAGQALAACSVSLGPAVINSTSNVTTYAFASFTPCTSCTLVVIAHCRTTVAGGSITNTSGTSLTWTRETSAGFASGDTMYLFWANTPSSTAASVYTLDLTGDAATGCGATLWQVTGSDIATGTPIRTVGSGAGTSTNPTVQFSQALDTNNCYVAQWMGALSSTDPANVSAPPTGWTEDGDHGFGTPTSSHTQAHRSTGDTSTTVTFTAASTTWGSLGAEIYTSGAGPASVGPLLGMQRNRIVIPGAR